MVKLFGPIGIRNSHFWLCQTRKSYLTEVIVWQEQFPRDVAGWWLTMLPISLWCEHGHDTRRYFIYGVHKSMTRLTSVAADIVLTPNRLKVKHNVYYYYFEFIHFLSCKIAYIYIVAQIQILIHIPQPTASCSQGIQSQRNL